jgi:hypothetical protein
LAEKICFVNPPRCQNKTEVSALYLGLRSAAPQAIDFTPLGLEKMTRPEKSLQI